MHRESVVFAKIAMLVIACVVLAYWSDPAGVSAWATEHEAVIWLTVALVGALSLIWSALATIRRGGR